MLLTRKLMPLMMLIAVALGIAGASGGASAAAKPIRIYLNGINVNSDVAPYIVPKANVTMVPLRVISESLKATVGWKQSTQTATITQGDLRLTMKVGQKFALVGEAKAPLDASVELKSGRAMVPLRFVSEQLGLNVAWTQATSTIRLTTKDAPSELRGAWISTVYNLDWPSAGSYGNAAQQQQEFAQQLDQLQAAGMNAVFVQLRPYADAFYPSTLVPWSKFLTGKQGTDPGYDPLKFMIEETHRRGMAFHAWFNPFRANPDANTSALAGNHVAIAHPDWIVNAAGQLYLNPGIPEVRQHIVDVIMEVVRGYDVDGVHMDDYFYPESKFDDAATFANYNLGNFLKVEDWRRDNINQFVKKLGQSIGAAKPNVEFGISPFGVWRNIATDPTGSDTKAGVESYDDHYADVRTWVKNGWIDYVMPQIYWSLSFSAARYDKLVDWWAGEVRGTNVRLYVGHAAHKIGGAETGWNVGEEMINQLMYNKKYAEIGGDVFFRSQLLLKNPLGIIQLMQQYYKVGSP